MSGTQKTLAPDDARHGTTNAYKNWDCRCEPCRSAWSAYQKERRYDLNECACGGRKSRKASKCRTCTLAELEPDHGTESRYVGHGCRCVACRTAASTAKRQRRAANAEAERAYQREYKRRRRAAAKAAGLTPARPPARLHSGRRPQTAPPTASPAPQPGHPTGDT